jgi:pimeloyl-ACP methyl ester carboxylesterase
MRDIQRTRRHAPHLALLCLLLSAALIACPALTGCGVLQPKATAGDAAHPSATYDASASTAEADGKDALAYVCDEVPLERAGVALHLDRTQVRGAEPMRDILLVHGVTYSSHEFDIDYEDYSLVRFLARMGYAVWRLDIAGFGQSQEVADGFLPDSSYASEDINAAVEAIVAQSGRSELDVLGWSWGTVTTSLFAKNHPERLGKLVLYAPILSGIGEVEVTEPFHANDWEHAASDFQMGSDGTYDPAITDPLMVELFCSSCWHYDGEHSPNGGRRDICVSKETELIDLAAIQAPTLVIHGDADPYLNYELTGGVLEKLPAGSDHVVIAGGAHVVMYEKPYYREFQEALAKFLA